MRKFRSQQVVEKHKRIFRAKFVFFLIFLFILTFLISYSSKRKETTILNINIVGNEVVQDKDILEIVNKNLEGDYLKLFSRSNIFLYPKFKIKRELFSSFLIINKIVISFSDLHTINVNITERKPFALYCEDQEIQTLYKVVEPSDLKDIVGKSESCYFMDDQAYIYAKAMSFSNNVYFKYYQEKNNANSIQEILGSTYLTGASGKQFEKVNLFIRFLKDINLNVYRLTIKENDDYELLFGNNSKLLFEGKQDFDILLENLQAILIDLGDIEEKEFEYIDLRFNNKVFHKFKD
ncbi:MAG: hypothetical protein KAJ58_02010 [Candidatus Pacebacteria bacterium]|nr:hypothetical protein [Candidatus Paceibacterota bacterium]